MARKPTILGLHAILFLSGAGSFGYQVVWSRQLALGLGQEMAAVLAVASAMLAGLAVGAWLFDRLTWLRTRPLRTYACAEGVAGLWGMLSLWTVPRAASLARGWIGLEPSATWQWTVALLVPLVVLLPASLALGATFPAMEAVLQRAVAKRRWVGSLYSSQTFGAVLGVLGGGLWLVARGGDGLALVAFATANGLCALGALAVGRRLPVSKGVASRDGQASPAPVGGAGGSPPGLLFLLAATGLLGVGYEVLAVRVLRDVLEGTVYTYAVILAVYLVGSAAGALTQAKAAVSLRTLLASLAAACWVGGWMARWAPAIYSTMRARLGDSLGATLTAEGFVAAGVLLLPSFLMGWTFSQLAQWSRNRTGRLGPAVAVNLLAAAVAPVVFGVVLTPWVGPDWAGLGVVAGYLLLAGLDGSRKPAQAGVPTVRVSSRGLLALASALAAAVLLRSQPGQLPELPAGSRVVAERRGVAETVRVIEDGAGARTLRVGGHLNMGGTGAIRPQQLQAHIPLLLHPDPRRALFLGAGTAITLGACVNYPELRATGVELLPEIAAMAGWFDSASGFNSWPSRIRLVSADARRFVQSTPEPWDVIVGDLFHPGRDGAAALFTREHFTAVRGRLAEGGLFVQWLPLHQLQGAALKSVIRTFLEVFPDAQAWWLRWEIDVPVLGLAGGRGAPRLPPDWLNRRSFVTAALPALESVGINDWSALWLRFAADATQLRAWSEGALVNTDDHPVVAFLAPHLTVRAEVEPFAAVRELLALPESERDVVFDLAADGSIAAQWTRIVTGWQARDLYLRGLIAEADAKPDEAVAHWLEGARRSQDFTTGYARCLSLAVGWARERPAAAQALLRALEDARPERPVARELRLRLFPERAGDAVSEP